MTLKQTERTGPDGRFQLRVAPAYTLLIVRGPGFAFAWMNLGSPGDIQPRFVLQPAAPLTARVIDSQGKPVSDAEVWVQMALGGSGFGSREAFSGMLMGSVAKELFSTKSGADGTFQLEGLPHGTTVGLAARKPGLSLPAVEDAWFGNGAGAKVGQTNNVVKLVPTASFEGKVIDQRTSNGIAGFQLRAIARSGNSAEATQLTKTEQDGTFRFPDLAPGSYTFRGLPDQTHRPGWVLEGSVFSLRSGQKLTNRVLKAHPGARVMIAVRSKTTAAPIPRVSLRVNRNDFVTDDNGNLSLQVVPGELEILPGHRWYQERSFHTNIIAGTTNQIELLMIPRPTLTGLVLNPAGQLVPNARVIQLLSESPTDESLARTKQDGTFELLWHENWDSEVREFSAILVQETGQNLAAYVPMERGKRHYEITLEPAIVASGFVKDAQGRPVPNAQISYQIKTSGFPKFMGTVTMTDQDGRYEVRALPKGRTITILANDRETFASIDVPASTNSVVQVPTITLEDSRSALQKQRAPL